METKERQLNKVGWIIVQQKKRVLLPPQGIYINIWCVYLWAVLQKWNSHPGGRWWQHAEHVNPRLVGTRKLVIKFPEHPVTSPPKDQKKVLHSVPLTPTFASINCSLTATGEFGSFEHELPTLLVLCPENKRCTLLHHNLMSIDWLCCVAGEWIQVWFGNFRTLPYMKQNSLYTIYDLFLCPRKSPTEMKNFQPHIGFFFWHDYHFMYVAENGWVVSQSSSNIEESFCTILANIFFYQEKNYTIIFNNTLFPRTIGDFSPSDGYWRQHSCFPWCEAGMILPPW